MNSASIYVPNLQSQMRYLLEWFKEFSEMQKGDFLPVLIQRFGNRSYVNGLLPGLEALGNIEDRPPTLFQCRIELFNEWTETWGIQEKNNYFNKSKTLTLLFAKYEKEIDIDVKSSSSDDHL